MSLDINDDPEVWAFTDKFGDRALRTMVQVFAILERTENRWRLAGDWSATISRKVRQQSASVRRQVLQMVANGWLTVEEWSADGSPAILSATNYWKFHKRAEPKRDPIENQDGAQHGPLLPTIRHSDILKSPDADAGSAKKTAPVPGPRSPVSGRAAAGPAPPDPKVVNLHQQTEADALVNLAIEVAGRDEQRRQKLCQWTISMVRCLEGEPPERTAAVVRASLEVVRRKISDGYPIRSIWALLSAIFDKERTREIQGPENERHKRGPINAALLSDIMAGMAKGA